MHVYQLVEVPYWKCNRVVWYCDCVCKCLIHLSACCWLVIDNWWNLLRLFPLLVQPYIVVGILGVFFFFFSLIMLIVSFKLVCASYAKLVLDLNHSYNRCEHYEEFCKISDIQISYYSEYLLYFFFKTVQFQQ